MLASMKEELAMEGREGGREEDDDDDEEEEDVVAVDDEEEVCAFRFGMQVRGGPGSVSPCLGETVSTCPRQADEVVR